MPATPAALVGATATSSPACPEILACAARTTSLYKATDLIDPRLRDALRRLPARDAALLAMLAFEDMSIADAAATLGVTVQTAKTRLHRARARIRALVPDLDSTLAPEGARR